MFLYNATFFSTLLLPLSQLRHCEPIKYKMSKYFSQFKHWMFSIAAYELCRLFHSVFA